MKIARKIRWRMSLSLLITLSLLLSVGPEIATAQENSGNKVFLPLVSSGAPRFEVTNNQFVWRLKYDNDAKSAAVEKLPESGQEWIERTLSRCDFFQEAQQLTQNEVYNCEMLRYTLAGKFKPDEIQTILANDGVLLAVGEVKVTVLTESSDVNASQANTCTGNHVHPTTCETLYTSVSKPWYSTDATHTAYAGPPGGISYKYIKLRAVSQRSDNTIRYQNNYVNGSGGKADMLYENREYASKSYYVGLCCYGGGFAITEAWIRSYDYPVDIYMGAASINL